ncbi:MAG: GerMN domain-containing protein [Clostridia bacterium]
MKKKLKKVSVICVLLIMAMFATVGCAKKKDDDTNVGDLGNDEYSPVSSMTLSDTEAAALNNSVKVKVYYKTAKGDKISCETKLLQFTDKDRKADVLAGKIIEMLIAGPSNSSLVKTIPEGTKLNSVKIKNNVVYIDFNEAFASAVAKGEDVNFIAYSIANTLTEFKNINEVAITSGGSKIETQSGCNFAKLNRNMEIVTDIESAMPETDYSENVFLEIELE